uniref:Protein odr-4 homolog n=1 Tax=Cynoglossus semilaevis TaxID=244447 RepID=A0A3P8WRW3_CYNSE
MGRGYLVEDAVEKYLSELCTQHAVPVTGLLIGQSSTQRDFVIMATRTPQREESPSKQETSPDKEWVTEHARQVSRMLPGGLSVLGVFIITENDGKDTQTALRQLVFAVENLISSERLWSPADDDVTDCVTLHINPKTRKTVCRTFDVKDPKCMAKPADWKYQSGVCSSWSMLSCCLNVDMLVPLPDNRAVTEDMETCLKDGLKIWADKICSGVCLIDGKKLPEDTELTTGQVKKFKRNTVQNEQRSTKDVIQSCGGSVSVRGTVHARAYLHNNKPRAKLAEKRDVVSTVATRVQMLLEELLTSEVESKSKDEQLCLPRRVFCLLKGAGSLCVCDYQFNDEGPGEVTDRLKEMLDIDAAEEDLDTRQELNAEMVAHVVETGWKNCVFISNGCRKKVHYIVNTKSSFLCVLGAAIAAAAAVLAAAASMLYLSEA